MNGISSNPPLSRQPRSSSLRALLGVTCIFSFLLLPMDLCRSSSQALRSIPDVEYWALLLGARTLILQHPAVCVSPAPLPAIRVVYLESFLTSSLSNCSDALGVFASSTKWLSQWGQYSSLQRLVFLLCSTAWHARTCPRTRAHPCGSTFCTFCRQRPSRRPVAARGRSFPGGTRRSRTICGLEALVTTCL